MQPAPPPSAPQSVPPAAAAQTAGLTATAQTLGGGLPALLVAAEHLADTVAMGAHGRKRAGLGDAFWQYRLAQPGDPARAIDWRRSARADQTYVREREAEIAQTLVIWADGARSMAYTGDARRRPPKADRARLLALAAAVLALRGGERVGLIPSAPTGSDAGSDTESAGALVPARSGRPHRMALATGLLAGSTADYGAPDPAGLPPRGTALVLTDGLGPPEPLLALLATAAGRGVTGALVQVLDPAEEEFAFDGRTIFESMGGGLRHETRRAADLRARYRDRLAARKGTLAAACGRAGWLYAPHHTDQSAQSALLWIWRALERVR